MPNGQFGTRLQGGKDSASERYIFTQLSKITRCIFKDYDDKILNYLNDDGFPVEPLFYAPIVPMILVNGTKGIGTGFSTDIMSYNPQEIIYYLKDKLQGKKSAYDFVPYYDRFNGTISKIADGKFIIKGKYETLGPDKIRITELPVGTWTDDFKEYLESLTDSVDKSGKKVTPLVKDYDDMSKDTTIDFTITLQKGKLEELESIVLDHGCNGLEKQFHLFTTNTTTNMHLFDANDKLKKYSNVVEIIDDYFVTRLQLYQTRKDYIISTLKKELLYLTNKARYIKENLDGSIDLRRKRKEEILALLKSKEYSVMDDDDDYKYLTKMPMDSVSEENVEKLENEYREKTKHLEKVNSTKPEELWLEELKELEEEYIKFKEERLRNDENNGELKKQKKTVLKKKIVVEK